MPRFPAARGRGGLSPRNGAVPGLSAAVPGLSAAILIPKSAEDIASYDGRLRELLSVFLTYVALGRKISYMSVPKEER
jgi:hypothetical protein